MKILTILGARPQFIKAGNLSRELKKYDGIREIIVHTGQHYDANMSDIFFEQMQIPKPDYKLNSGGKTHAAMTADIMCGVEEIAIREKPDFIVVYGDTNSTLAGALVASKLHIKLAHIEAGLRSFNMLMPEEINRILTDRVSNILFCPTDVAVQNLKNEGFDRFECKIIKSGDIMQDGAMFYKKIAKKPSIKINNNFILCTVYRAENTDDKTRLAAIFTALNDIATQKQIILPLHPRTKNIIKNLDIDISNISVIEPVGYLEMVWLIDNCDFVMTDSGGLQKEAFFFKKPCLTLRDETEWVELVKCGANKLVGADKNKILFNYELIKNGFHCDFELDLYGSGKASEIIVKNLIQ